MKAAVLALILGLAYSQTRECMYNDAGGSKYTLNLTSIAEWRMEKETSNRFYYYTPCRNGLNCYQGNADFYNNFAQYVPGANQCTHYLSIDHRENPRYSFNAAAWIFEYEDGEICDVTQQPRRSYISYECFEEYPPNYAMLYNVEEPEPCVYVAQVRSSLACIPENKYNENCQWRVPNPNGGYYSLDLSSINGTVLRGYDGNAYQEYFTPCQNGLHCYQQTGRMVMGIIENRQTRTCEHYGAEFESGRVQPSVHGSQANGDFHFSFHYYGGQSCSDGSDNFFDVRYFCNETATVPYVMTSYVESNCRFYMNVSTNLACQNQSTNIMDTIRTKLY